MKKNWILSFIIGLFLICWVSSAYFPYKNEWNCSEVETKEDKEKCENEMSFAKFTETTGTREMSTTCCSYLEHEPKFNLWEEIPILFWWLEVFREQGGDFNKIGEKVDQERNAISGSVQQLTDLVLKLSAQIYEQSSNKIQTTKTLSSLFKSCSENNNNLEARIVCKHFSYDLIWKEPKITAITLSDLNTTFKKEKELIQRTIHYNELNENYTPITAYYAWVNTMYRIGDYAFWTINTYDYFDDKKKIDSFKILVLKAGDTHWQEFAKIKGNDNNRYEATLSFENHKLNLNIPIFQKKEQERLTAQFQLQRDWKRNLVDCFEEKFNTTYVSPNDLISRKKAPLKSCEVLGTKITNTLWK